MKVKCSLRNSMRTPRGTVAKLAMRQPFVLFKGLTFQKLC
ncbi:recombinase family protein, partial [Escherichia coli]